MKCLERKISQCILPFRRGIKTSDKLKLSNNDYDSSLFENNMYRLFQEKNNIVASFLEFLEFPEEISFIMKL